MTEAVTAPAGKLAAPPAPPADKNPDLEIKRVAPPVIPPGMTDIGGTVAGNDAARAAVRASHADLLTKTGGRPSEPGEPAADAAPPPAMIEDVESIELQLPDGRVLEIGPPQKGSLTYRILVLMGNDSPPTLSTIAKELLSIRSINGKPPPHLTSKIELLLFMDALGDDALDLIHTAYDQHWPVLTTAALKVIKKNLR